MGREHTVRVEVLAEPGTLSFFLLFCHTVAMQAAETSLSPVPALPVSSCPVCPEPAYFFLIGNGKQAGEGSKVPFSRSHTSNQLSVKGWCYRRWHTELNQLVNQGTQRGKAWHVLTAAEWEGRHMGRTATSGRSVHGSPQAQAVVGQGVLGQSP